MPTSPRVVRRICDRLDLDGRRVVVELGPGLGCFTRELLARLTPDSRLVPIESNSHFAGVLGEIPDPRLRVVHGNADDIREVMGGERAHVVLSGIPFSHFDDARTETLLARIRDVLVEGGSFVAYQCSSKLRRPLERLFGGVSVDRHFLNVPPLVSLQARKSQAG